MNQFTVVEGQQQRRPDLVVFVNGLPLAVIELKNPADENATIWSAFHQLGTDQAQIPAMFTITAQLIASDCVQARPYGPGDRGADQARLRAGSHREEQGHPDRDRAGRNVTEGWAIAHGRRAQVEEGGK